MKNPLILVDGSSYLFRAFYALPPLTNQQGEPTGAIYGVLNMLRKLQEDFKTAEIIVVFDAKGPTFRHELYAEYKANRGAMPEELAQQIEPLHDIIRAQGLPLIAIQGVEADDVIGTLAKQATDKKQSVLIATGDKDMAQLVNDYVQLIDTMKNVQLDAEGVQNKYGVKPAQIIDLLALSGDTSDNIPGIPGVGAKTAQKWLAQYQTLDNLIAHQDEIKGKIGDKLRDNIDLLNLSKQLVTIDCAVSLQDQQDLLESKTADIETLIDYYTRFEFKRWLKELNSEPSQSNAQTTAKNPVKYLTVYTQAELNNVLSQIENAALFAIDTETTSLDSMQAKLVGLSLATNHIAAYIPLAHDYPNAPQQLALGSVLAQLKPILQDPNKQKVGQHIKYDMNILSRYGIDLQGVQYDTMLESYILNSTATRHNLDALAQFYLNHQTISFEEIAGKGAKQITFNQIEIDKAAPYACEDADITLQLHQTLWPQLQQQNKLTQVYLEKEQPLIKILAKMEQTGVLIDSDKLKQQSKDLAQRIAAIEEQAYCLAGDEFNLGSPKQLQDILFNKLNLPVIKKTPKGQPSTAEEVLQELAQQYELPQLILQHRSFSKLKSTYLDKLPKQVNPNTGRVHTSYHQAVAATGRLSSSDPNLQNIPIRTEEGKAIRDAFIAPSGYQLVCADYSQIELRIMAHLSQDKTLIQSFADNLDIHKATASEVFSTPLEQVTTEQRRAAKAVNFGLIYGMSAFGLAKQLNISRNEAQDYIDIYFARYPGVEKYMSNIRSQAKQQGYVETIYGRRLYLSQINSKNVMQQKAAERTAINAPMQGTAADIIKQAMINIDQFLTQNQKLDIKMIMQVHDELVFEVKSADINQAIDKIKALMEQAASLSVPLIAEVNAGYSWKQAH